MESCEPGGGEAANRWYTFIASGGSGKDVRQLFEAAVLLAQLLELFLVIATAAHRFADQRGDYGEEAQVFVETALEKVKSGDTIVIHTGESAPVDGEVIDGMAMIDQHALTGESAPVEKTKGDKV